MDIKSLTKEEIKLYFDVLLSIFGLITKYNEEWTKGMINEDSIVYSYIFNTPYEDLPLLLNHPSMSPYTLNIIQWRLKIGR
jgi:hypothetical protein